MKGWHTQIAGEYEAPSGVIGVVVAPKFPDLDIIREKIREGAERRPDDVWVIREKPQANHAVNAVWDTLAELGIEPLPVPLVPCFQHKGVFKKTVKVPLDECEQDTLTFTEYVPGAFDRRRAWADSELRSTCDRIIVFHDKSSNLTAEWGQMDGRSKPYTEGRDRCTANIFVIERGSKKPIKRRAGRKPQGV